METDKGDCVSQIGRGEEAVRDMRGRLAAGWTIDMLWDRYVVATSGDGFTYDFAEVSDACPATEHCLSAQRVA